MPVSLLNVMLSWLAASIFTLDNEVFGTPTAIFELFSAGVIAAVFDHDISSIGLTADPSIWRAH